MTLQEIPVDQFEALERKKDRGKSGFAWMRTNVKDDLFVLGWGTAKMTSPNGFFKIPWAPFGGSKAWDQEKNDSADCLPVKSKKTADGRLFGKAGITRSVNN